MTENPNGARRVVLQGRAHQPWGEDDGGEHREDGL